jgi:ribonuclease T
MQTEIYFSVDVETAGPVPGPFALLSIGACLVADPAATFYIELQPDAPDYTDEAVAIHGLSLDALSKTGIPPKAAMQAFADWVDQITPLGQRPIFVAFNAPFDWMFVHSYFTRYLGYNPFGHSALDIKAYFMGQAGVTWGETSMKHVASHFLVETHLTHNALNDAQDQAQIFQHILAQAQRSTQKGG